MECWNSTTTQRSQRPCRKTQLEDPGAYFPELLVAHIVASHREYLQGLRRETIPAWPARLDDQRCAESRTLPEKAQKQLAEIVCWK